MNNNKKALFYYLTALIICFTITLMIFGNNMHYFMAAEAEMTEMEINDTETVETDTNNAETPEAETDNVETTEAETNNVKTPETDTNNPETTDMETDSNETVGTDAVNTEIIDEASIGISVTDIEITEQEEVEPDAAEPPEAEAFAVRSSDDLRQALLNASPGDVIPIDSFTIDKTIGISDRDINVTLASYDGNPVTLSLALDPVKVSYFMQFLRGNVTLTFDNVILDGAGALASLSFNLSDKTRKNDLLTINNGVFQNFGGKNNGGAIHSEAGCVTLNNCRFINNRTANEKVGGAVYLSNGNLTVINTQFEGNRAGTSGGAAFVSGSVTAINSRFIDNVGGSSGSGGAICAEAAELTDSTFTCNRAGLQGGALSLGSSPVSIQNCVFEDNSISATEYEQEGIGEIYAPYGVDSYRCGGGAINLTSFEFNEDFTKLVYGSCNVSITNSLFEDNYGLNGGGVFIQCAGSFDINDCVFDNNEAEQGGGGVWVADLDNLRVSNGRFRDNKASAGYFWKIDSPADEKQSADAVIHAEKILNTSYSVPYRNAYNNYDINYNTAVLLTPVTVTYDGNGNDSGQPPTDLNSPYIAGQEAAILTPPDSFAKTEYDFVGWDTEPTGTGERYVYDNENMQFEPPSFIMDAENIVLYAQWEEQVIAIPDETPNPLEEPKPIPEIPEDIATVQETPTPEPVRPEVIEYGPVYPIFIPEMPGEVGFGTTSPIPAPETPTGLKPTGSTSVAEIHAGLKPTDPNIIAGMPAEFETRREEVLIIPETLEEAEAQREEQLIVLEPHDEAELISNDLEKVEDEGAILDYPPVYQLVEADPGIAILEEADDSQFGLLNKNEDPERTDEDNKKSMDSRIVLFGLLFLCFVGLAAGIYFLIIARRYVTREEYVRYIVREINLEADSENTAKYSDVSENDSFYRAVMSAKEVGLLSGLPEEEFQPHAAITREEIASVLTKTIQYANVRIVLENIELSAVFKDFKSMNEMYLPDIRTVVQLQIMNEKHYERFYPKGLSTKRQALKTIKGLRAVISPYLPQ